VATATGTPALTRSRPARRRSRRKNETPGKRDRDHARLRHRCDPLVRGVEKVEAAAAPVSAASDAPPRSQVRRHGGGFATLGVWRRPEGGRVWSGVNTPRSQKTSTCRRDTRRRWPGKFPGRRRPHNHRDRAATLLGTSWAGMAVGTISTGCRLPGLSQDLQLLDFCLEIEAVSRTSPRWSWLPHRSCLSRR